MTIFLLLCGFGFFAVPLGGFYITAGRISLFIFLYLFLFTFFLYRGKVSINIKVGRYLLFFALWFLWAVVSLFWTSLTVNTARHIEALVIGTLLIIFSLLFLSTEDGIKSIHRLWIISTVVFIGIGIWESATGMHLTGSREAAWVGIRETYPSAVFWGPNVFATFLCLSFPFIFVLLGFLRPLAKLLGATLILTSFYFITLVGSRANIVAFLIGACLIFLLPGVRTRFKSMATTLVVVGMIVFSGYTFLSPAMSSNFDLFKTIPQQITSVKSEDPSTRIRMNLVRNGLIFLRDSHFLGVGAGSFEYWIAEAHLYYVGGITNAHNWWLEILVDYGVVIFALFLVFYIGLLWNLFHICRQSKNEILKAISLATFISLVEFSIASESASGLSREYFVWLLFATALCVINCYRLKEKGMIV